MTVEKSVSETLSTALTKAQDDEEKLVQQIKTLDQTVEEFAAELTTTLQNNKSLADRINQLQKDYQTALSTIFEINKINKELTDITNNQGDRIVALQSFLN